MSLIYFEFQHEHFDDFDRGQLILNHFYVPKYNLTKYATGIKQSYYDNMKKEQISHENANV